MQVQIEQQLFAGSSAVVDIPDISSWDEVDWWYVKWDTLFYGLKGSTKDYVIALDSDTMNLVNWDKPANVWVHDLDEDGDQTGEILDEIE